MEFGPAIAFLAMILAVAVVVMFVRNRQAPDPRAARPAEPQPEQAVLVHLDNASLAEHTTDDLDVATLEGRLLDVISRSQLGELDVRQIDDNETVLFMSGTDAEHLFRGIEGTLRDCPLCNGARVVIRRGAENAPQRELRL
jgi:hypothetical protein